MVASSDLGRVKTPGPVGGARAFFFSRLAVAPKARTYGKMPISVYEVATLSIALMNAAVRRSVFF